MTRRDAAHVRYNVTTAGIVPICDHCGQSQVCSASPSLAGQEIEQFIDEHRGCPPGPPPALRRPLSDVEARRLAARWADQ